MKKNFLQKKASSHPEEVIHSRFEVNITKTTTCRSWNDKQTDRQTYMGPHVTIMKQKTGLRLWRKLILVKKYQSTSCFKEMSGPLNFTFA